MKKLLIPALFLGVAFAFTGCVWAVQTPQDLTYTAGGTLIGGQSTDFVLSTCASGGQTVAYMGDLIISGITVPGHSSSYSTAAVTLSHGGKTVHITNGLDFYQSTGSYTFSDDGYDENYVSCNVTTEYLSSFEGDLADGTWTVSISNIDSADYTLAFTNIALTFTTW